MLVLKFILVILMVIVSVMIIVEDEKDMFIEKWKIDLFSILVYVFCGLYLGLVGSLIFLLWLVLIYKPLYAIIKMVEDFIGEADVLLFPPLILLIIVFVNVVKNPKILIITLSSVIFVTFVSLVRKLIREGNKSGKKSEHKQMSELIKNSKIERLPITKYICLLCIVLSILIIKAI